MELRFKQLASGDAVIEVWEPGGELRGTIHATELGVRLVSEHFTELFNTPTRKIGVVCLQPPLAIEVNFK
jgi:hypothetical protein